NELDAAQAATCQLAQELCPDRLGLNAHWFLTLADAAKKLEDWCRYYNDVRPHGAIGHKVPISLIHPDGATSPSS
ncbi:transposase, partial [Mesorhizobium sp. LNJC395A00]|uniref:transposase n=1 Tax=Mesorhizobium sp. LNJC395A00 TaxID=1287275 RepID=UPI001FD8FAEA